MNFSPTRRRLPLILDLTPLIDVVFLLLIFFMVTTTFVPDSTGLQVDLPRSSSQEVIPEGKDLTLELGADGTITLDGRSLDTAQLSAELRKAAEADTSTEIGLTSFAIATEGQGGATPARPPAPGLPSWLKNPLGGD